MLIVSLGCAWFCVGCPVWCARLLCGGIVLLMGFAHCHSSYFWRRMRCPCSCVRGCMRGRGGASAVALLAVRAWIILLGVWWFAGCVVVGWVRGFVMVLVVSVHALRCRVVSVDLWYLVWLYCLRLDGYSSDVGLTIRRVRCIFCAIASVVCGFVGLRDVSRGTCSMNASELERFKVVKHERPSTDAMACDARLSRTKAVQHRSYTALPLYYAKALILYPYTGVHPLVL